jgi:Mn2+/Fe2+ NRAMP family transporter
MLGENDGPSMLSYAATGAKFGIGFFLPFIVLTFAMAIVVQEMTVRLGTATHRGHAELIFERFGPFWGWFSMIDLGIGNFLTLITEFIAIRAGLGFFGVPPWAAVLAALALLYAALMTHTGIGPGNESRSQSLPSTLYSYPLPCCRSPTGIPSVTHSRAGSPFRAWIRTPC